MKNRIPKTILHTIAVCSFCIILHTVEGESLEDLLLEAVSNNPELGAASSSWEAAKTRIAQSRWLPDPRFSIGYEQLPAGAYSLGDARMEMYSVSQAIPFPSKLGVRGKIAGIQAMIAGEEYEDKLLTIVAKVKSAYYRLFLVHKSIQMKGEEKELLAQLEQIAQTKYAVGQASQHDVLSAQVALSLVSEELVTLIDADLPTAHAVLNALLNRPWDSKVEMPDSITVPKLVMSPGELTELALSSRHDLKALEHAVERAEASHTLAKMDYLPDFTIALKQEEMRMPLSTETRRGIMLSLNVPLWFWNKRDAVREKSAERLRAEALYQAMLNSVLSELKTAISRSVATQRRADLFRTTIVPQAEQALKAARIAYETGKVDFSALINSSRAFTDARLKYWRAVVEHGTSMADLERVLGVGLDQ